MSVSHKLRAFAGLTLAALAACSDNTGPAKLADPTTTVATVQALDSVFSVATIDAFTSIGDLIDPASGLAPAANLVRATQPEAPRPWASGYAGAAQRFRALESVSLSTSNTPRPHTRRAEGEDVRVGYRNAALRGHRSPGGAGGRGAVHSVRHQPDHAPSG